MHNIYSTSARPESQRYVREAGVKPVHTRRVATPQFSLAHLTMLACSPPVFIDIAAQAGYDFVSLRPISMGIPGEPRHPLATNPSLFRRTRNALRTNGVRLLDIELARILDGVDVRDYVPAMEAAAELGGRHVLTSAWCNDRGFVLERFIELCELAAPLGLTVDFEFVTFAAYRTLADALEVVSASGCANAGICVDTLHFDRGGSRLEELRAVPSRYIHYAQICDGPAAYSDSEDELKRIARDGRLYLGEGGIDVRGILSCMPQIPYSIELPNGQRLTELGAEEYARRCLVSARHYLTDTPRLVSA